MCVCVCVCVCVRLCVRVYVLVRTSVSWQPTHICRWTNSPSLQLQKITARRARHRTPPTVTRQPRMRAFQSKTPQTIEDLFPRHQRKQDEWSIPHQTCSINPLLLSICQRGIWVNTTPHFCPLRARFSPETPSRYEDHKILIYLRSTMDRPCPDG